MFNFITKYFKPELNVLRQRRSQALKKLTEEIIVQEHSEKASRLAEISKAEEELKVLIEDSNRIDLENKTKMKELSSIIEIATKD